MNVKNRAAAVRFTYSFLGISWCYLTLFKVDLGLQFGVAKICPTMNSTLLHCTECERDGGLAELLPTLVHLHSIFQGCEMCDLMDIFSGKLGF